MEDDLRDNAVYGAVEEPPFDGERKHREDEVGRALEEDVCHEPVGAAFPFCWNEVYKPEFNPFPGYLSSGNV